MHQIDAITLTRRLREYNNIANGDVVLTKFFETCLATKNQTACALYRTNETVANLNKKIRDLAEEIKFQPLVMGPNITTDVVTLPNLKTAIDTPLRIQIEYASSLSYYLDSIFSRNLTQYRLSRSVVVTDSTAVPGPTIDAIQNIRCTDSSYRSENFTDVKARVRKAEDLSYLYGDTYPSAFTTCARWLFKSKGRYNGDFKTKTKNPLLIIGSPYDLRTPINGAQTAHDLFEGSALLQHNGYGVSHPSSRNVSG